MTVLRSGLHGVSGPGMMPSSSMGGGAATAGYFQKMLSYGPLVYFPQWEAAGVVSDELVNGWDGAYTGVTLGQPGIGDGNTCPWFDGLNDFNNILTAQAVAGFDGQEGTAAIWARVNGAGVWTDGAWRVGIVILADGNNRLYISKNAINNQWFFRYNAGGVALTNAIASGAPTGWVHLAMTWSRSTLPTGEFRCYANGVQLGVTQVGLGAWIGAPTIMIIGANTLVPANVWHGWLAHGAVWTRALTPGEIADLAVV